MLNLRVVGQLHRTWSRKWSCCCNPRLGDGSHYSHSFSHPRYQRRHPSFHRICTFSRMSTTEVTEISSNMSLSSMLSAAQSRFVTVGLRRKWSPPHTERTVRFHLHLLSSPSVPPCSHTNECSSTTLSNPSPWQEGICMYCG